METIFRDGYSAPRKARPIWQTMFAVFQSGRPHLRTNSLTGPGIVYHNTPAGKFRPVNYVHVGGPQSLTGPGIIPYAPGGLTILQANPSGNNGNGIS